MIRTIILAVVVVIALTLVVSFTFAADPPAKPAVAADKETPGRTVDLAICLDTSNSMDGLIDSAKQKLWAVVNELATAKPHPKFRVALYQYGNDGLNRESGWVERVCDLTDDLDTIYGKLFALKTHGGTEYVARVIKNATEDLKWSGDKNALKIIFVAGNEPATQDEATNKLQDVCTAAASKGIIVNTIYCGKQDEGGWADAARWADGQYASIDQDKGTVVISTPYDKKLADLSVKVNETYVPYGKAGKDGLGNQAAQEGNAASVGSVAHAQRAAAKSSGLYNNARWDLVDASGEKDFDLAKVAEEDLPDNMKKMTAEERAKYVQEQAKNRAAVQQEIKELSAKREESVKQQMADKGLKEDSSFDAALRDAIRKQASAKGFEFEKPAPTAPATKPETPKDAAPAAK